MEGLSAELVARTLPGVKQVRHLINKIGAESTPLIEPTLIELNSVILDECTV